MFPKNGLAHTRLWHHIPATTAPLGRLSTQIAILLMGKHKSIYTPGNDAGDFVVVTQAEQVIVKGKGKIYQKHSGYPGGLKTVKLEDMLKKRPEDVIISCRVANG
jgi:large subunit ribosomal protein L13